MLFFIAPAFFINVIKAIFSKGSFTENLQDSYTTMGPLEMRLNLNDDSTNELPDFYQIEVRGLIPVPRSMDLSFAVSVLDVTDGENNKQPVLSAIDDYCEPHSRAFQIANELGRIQPNQGYIRWARMGAVIPDLLIPPVGGQRKLRVILRIYNKVKPVIPDLGFNDQNGSGELVAVKYKDVDHTFVSKGYVETAEARRRLTPLSIKLAVAVAFSDGEFHDEEGKLIKSWIERQLSVVNSARRDRVREECNEALRHSYAEAQAGELSLSAICGEIYELSDVSQRYEAIELCLDIMAADGRADVAELETIRRIADVFELDVDELQRLKDQRLVSIDVSDAFEASQDGMNEALGIDPSWPKEKIRKHLRAEFKKWNSRINNLTDEAERANAQSRLDLISKAREMYG